MSTLPAATSGRKTSITELPPLTLPFDSVSTESLQTVVAMVLDRWTAAVHAGALSAQTADKFGLLTARFARFAAAHSVVTARAIDADLVARFIAAQGRSRHGAVSNAAVATMHNRRSALRAFFRTARELGLIIEDPTTAIALPHRTDSVQRPITDEEASLVRLVSEREHPSRHGSTAALLLAGAHTSEIGHITIDDLNCGAKTIYIQGSTKYRSRTVPLNEWALRVLTTRSKYLSDPLPADEPTPVLCTGTNGSDAHKQARVCVTVREILTRAGLSDDPTIKPSSLTAYAARREFDRTKQIEAAAALIGSRSLDGTAALIGYQWTSTDV